MLKTVLKFVGSLFILLFVFVLGIAVSSKKETKHKVAVGIATVSGVISDSESVIKDLKELEVNPSVKVLVVRVDSPGGVVGPSQEIHDEIKRIAEKKPVYISMGAVAASGGYYVSAGATKIYANPGTLTGSIGVLLKLSNMEKLLDKIGLQMFSLKSGVMKTAGDPTETLTPEQRKVLQSVIDDTHQQFIKAVSDGRKIPFKDAEILADGRIYTGKQAKDLKLVDTLGGLELAIKDAAKTAGITGVPVIVKPTPPKKNFMQLLTAETALKVSNILVEQNMPKIF